MNSPKRSRHSSRSLRGVLLLLLITVLVPALALQVVSRLSVFQMSLSDERQANLELARAVGLAFGAYVRDVGHQELAVGLALTGLHPYTPEQANQFLKASTAEYGAARSFYWANPQGEVIASSDPQAIGLKIGEEPYFRQVLTGNELAVSDLLEDPLIKSMTFVIARRVQDEKGALAGVVAASVDPGKLGALALAIERPERGRITLFDRQGTVVYRSPEIEMTAQERRWLEKDPILRQARKGREATGILVSPADGERLVAARVPLKDIDWVVGASRPSEEIMAPMIRGFVIDLAVMLAIVAGSLLVALLIGSRITGPMARLREQARAIERGNLDHRVEPVGIAELADLGSAFNQMAAGLKRAQAEAEARGRSGYAGPIPRRESQSRLPHPPRRGPGIPQ